MPCPACGTENDPGESSVASAGRARARLPFLRLAELRRSQVLRRVWHRAGRAGRAGAGCNPAAERRMVSVLFVDLVGFTPHPEGRDAEDTRELLTRYFETCRG